MRQPIKIMQEDVGAHSLRLRLNPGQTDRRTACFCSIATGIMSLSLMDYMSAQTTTISCPLPCIPQYPLLVSSVRRCRPRRRFAVVAVPASCCSKCLEIVLDPFQNFSPLSSGSFYHASSSPSTRRFGSWQFRPLA